MCFKDKAYISLNFRLVFLDIQLDKPFSSQVFFFWLLTLNEDKRTKRRKIKDFFKHTT